MLDVRDQYRPGKPQDHIHGLQEPRQRHLAYPAGCVCLLHLVAELAGAFNRNSACYLADSHGVLQYCSPLSYSSDNLTNNEIGWKTELFSRHLQWNGAVYQEDWNNTQVSFFDPGVLGNVGFNANGPTYRIRGVETSIIAVLTTGLTFEGGASWNSSNQTNSP